MDQIYRKCVTPCGIGGGGEGASPSLCGFFLEPNSCPEKSGLPSGHGKSSVISHDPPRRLRSPSLSPFRTLPLPPPPLLLIRKKGMGRSPFFPCSPSMVLVEITEAKEDGRSSDGKGAPGSVIRATHVAHDTGEVRVGIDNGVLRSNVLLC